MSLTGTSFLYTLTAQSPALRNANDPLVTLRKAGTPPRIALYLCGQPHDGYAAAVALEQSAKAPTTVHVVYVPKSAGGHTMALWRPQVVPSFRWLTLDMGQSRPARGATPPAPSTAGARHAELASGTASRVAAVRRR